MTRRRLHTLRLEAIVELSLKRPNQFAPLMDTIKGIDLRHLGTKFFFVTLYQTTDSNETTLFAATLFHSNLFEKDIDRLLLGIADEATCVDNNDIAIVTITVKIELESGFTQVASNMFGVDDVFRASEGDNIYFQWNYIYINYQRASLQTPRH